MINREGIKPLIALQQAQVAYNDVSEQLSKIPEALETIERQLADSKDRNIQIHQNADQARKRCREAERNLSDLQQALEKYNKQISDVKSNKEYSAIIAEIASIKSKINDAETEILVAIDELDALTAETGIADEVMAKEESEIAKQRIVLNEERLRLEQALRTTQSDLEQARQAVPADLMSQYDRIHKYTGSTVVAPAAKRNDTYSCGGCYVQIPLQTVNELRKGNVFQCEACARLIYWCSDEP
jgi:predicted  nucleic acid-binding Zn-ribbon protein